MVRSAVSIADAVPQDAEALVSVWGGLIDRTGEGAATPHAVQEAASAIARIAADPDERLVVARIDERVAGAVHLSRAPLSPLHTEAAVYVMHLQVVEACRRHGVGRALMEATVSWAEEKDTTHVVAAASAASRDANRFMARLGLAPLATVRGSTVQALRAKLPVEPPVAARVNSRSHRNVGQVLAQRRSLRRAQGRAT
jgi:GNAT superfamily N-acetyltransferase